MPIKIDQKKAIVAELSEVASRSAALIVAEYSGLTVEELTLLRMKSRQLGLHVKVYRNTLARRAVANTSFACVVDALVGPVILVFAQDDAGKMARLIKDFSKDHGKLIVQALVLEGELLKAEQLSLVASLPSREEGLAQLLMVLKAPITKYVRTLCEPYAQLVRLMAAIRDKKEAA